MTIEQIIDELDYNNIEKSKLLICLLRNTEEYHEYLSDDGIRTFGFNSYAGFPKVIDIILHNTNELLVKYTILSVKKYKYQILKSINGY